MSFSNDKVFEFPPTTSQTRECPSHENLKSYNSRDLRERFRCTNPDRRNTWKTIKSTEKLPRDKTWLKKLSSVECRGAHDRKKLHHEQHPQEALAASLLNICAALCGNANGSINHVQHWALKSSVKAANLPFSGDLISFASASPVMPHSKSINTFKPSRGLSHELVMTLGTIVILTSSILIADLGLVCRTLGGVYYSQAFRRHLKLIWQKISANFKLFGRARMKSFQTSPQMLSHSST